MSRFEKEENKQEVDDSNSKTPLRNYSDENPVGTPPSMFLFRFEVTAYWLLPLLIFCAILFGGVYLAFKFDLFNRWSSDFERPPSYISASGDINVEELLEYYLASVGGRERLESIRSIRFKGHLVENTGEIAFQILISLPDKGMIITNPGEDYSQKMVRNGDRAWQAVGLGDGTEKIVPLAEADAESLAWSMQVHDTFRRHALKERSDGYTAREIEFQGKPSIELSKEMPDGSQYLAVLDKETLFLVKSVEMVPGPEGMERLESVYSDHRRDSGVVHAYETKTYKHGEPYNQTILHSVELNPGLVSSLFKVPETLMD